MIPLKRGIWCGLERNLPDVRLHQSGHWLMPDPTIGELGKISAGHGNDIADYQGRGEHSPILDVEGDDEEECPGTDAEGDEEEQPLGLIVDNSEEDDAGDAEVSGGRPKRKRGVSKTRRWSHINPQNKWALQQSGGLQRSSCSLASRQRLLSTGEFASHGEARNPEIDTTC
jgi:hypothetical protein